MAKAQTEEFEELIIDVALDPAAPTVFTAICGIVDATVTRTSNIDTTEVPDCDDESLPMSIERSVRSQEVSVTGNGVWAKTSWGALYTWWSTGAKLPVRVRHAAAAVGDPGIETGVALLATLTSGRTKGQKVTNEIEIQFDGVPVATNVPA